MRILVVEDKELHRKAAKATLSRHALTIVGSFDEAMEFMQQEIDEENVARLLAEAGFPAKPNFEKEEQWRAHERAYRKAQTKSVLPFQFEVVLTDMMMPMSKRTLAPGVFNPGEQVPYGFIIALRAALCGAKFVAMVTDTNHHQGAMSAAIDHLGEAYYHDGFSPNFVINGAKVMFVHSPLTGVPGTTCPECKGAKQVDHACYDCDGSGKKMEWYPPGEITSYSTRRPIEGTVCDACQGAGKKIADCSLCRGDGTSRGKNWGQILQDLTSE